MYPILKDDVTSKEIDLEMKYMALGGIEHMLNCEEVTKKVFSTEGTHTYEDLVHSKQDVCFVGHLVHVLACFHQHASYNASMEVMKRILILSRNLSLQYTVPEKFNEYLLEQVISS